MADKPVGTIFVELDLDASRYTKGQRQLLKDAQTSSTVLEKNFQNLGIKSAATMDLMRSKIMLSYEAIVGSAKATANDIIRAEEAKNAKLKALNDQQFGAQVSAIDKLKKNWIAASAAVFAAIAAINKALAYMEEGAKDMQVESSFKIMTDSVGADSERMISSMREATRETINASDMMQKAIKLMTLGYNPEQIERFSRVVITASQIAGTTAAQAYDELADAIANRMPKALVRMGAVTKEQMEIVNKAIDAGADSMVLYELAMANLELKQKMLQGTQDQVIISMQQLHARTSETTEAIGKGLIIALDYAYRAFEYLAGAAMGLVSAYARYRAMIYTIMGDEKQAADNRFIADVAYETRNDLIKRAGQGILDNAEAEKRATKDEIDGAKAKVEAQMSVLKATAEAANAKKKNEDEVKKAAEVNKTFWEEYKKEVEGATEFEKYKLEEQFKAFDKYVHDKAALMAWYQAERRKIEIKEFAETAGTQFPADRYDIEAQRAKAYAANAEANRKYAKSVEDQLAANAKADQMLNDENWWKTYIEDTEDATRANEIFADSMNIMSQNAADAFAEFATGTKSASDAFQQMVQSMLAAMLRLTAQRQFEQLFGMILSGGGGLFSSLFSGGSTPTGMGTNTTFSGGGTMGSYMGMVKHSGGIMSEGGPSRQVPAMVFANAPRYHNGLAPDEVPAILRRDEGVFTPGQMKALGSSSLTINVPVNMEAKGNKMSSELRTEIEYTVERVVRRYS